MLMKDYPVRWSLDDSLEWNLHRWFCGVNYLPVSAVNGSEMWQAATFDPAGIDRELGWAGRIGLNLCRVFLPFHVWEADPLGFQERFEQFLRIASSHGLQTMPILFDDCAFAGKQPYLGPQDPPVPGVHNSGWTPSPGHALVEDRAVWPRLEAYVCALVAPHAGDARIAAWDLYNEPGNGGMGERSLPLLREVFAWARGHKPIAPLTAGVWDENLHALNAASLELSDVPSFHHYGPLDKLEAQVGKLRAQTGGRPLLCTEWMARTLDSRFATHLPYLRRERIGCVFWGLVQGRTQTHFPWGSEPGAPEPEIWFHDVLRADGTYYDPAEIDVIRQCLANVF
jgi:hypothetical protein